MTNRKTAPRIAVHNVLASELAKKLNPFIGSTPFIQQTCCTIILAARSYYRTQLDACNGPSNGINHAAFEVTRAARERRAERELREAVDRLPRTDAGAITLTLDGDPRGLCVYLTLPGELARHHDDFGRRGLCVEHGAL